MMGEVDLALVKKVTLFKHSPSSTSS